MIGVSTPCVKCPESDSVSYFVSTRNLKYQHHAISIQNSVSYFYSKSYFYFN
ncbi:hypothetical protein SLEP1_g57531 [Rubroshorea leprosula]|uniref:Uncharacterized protein n=1 Tax=Rubroshorea leprosula TaxID=152421 RepID=A0AAV5MN70_9ROSI|nr:hypothetical protein SLEP1_g57531 [Rubroshorea leprosula]